MHVRASAWLSGVWCVCVCVLVCGRCVRQMHARQMLAAYADTCVQQMQMQMRARACVPQVPTADACAADARMRLWLWLWLTGWPSVAVCVLAVAGGLAG